MRKHLTATFLFLFFFCLSSHTIQAKSYTIDSLDIDAHLEQSGVMHVEEKRVFNFDGSYTFAYQYIKRLPNESKGAGRIEPYILENVTLCDQVECYQLLEGVEKATADTSKVPGTFYVDEENDQYYIKWFYNVYSEQKEFTLSYDVANAVTIHSDVSELYWKWVGDEWELAHGPVTVNLNVAPQSGEALLQAWAHGPLNGIVARPTDSTFTFTVPSLEMGTFFEGRVLMNNAVFADGAPGTLNKESITKQEEGFIRDTENKKR